MILFVLPLGIAACSSTIPLTYVDPRAPMWELNPPPGVRPSPPPIASAVQPDPRIRVGSTVGL